MDGETLQQKATHKGRENSQLQDLQRHEGGVNRLWNLSEPVQGTSGHHGAKAKACQRYCVYICGVAQHAEDTPGQGRQGTNPSKWCSGPTK